MILWMPIIARARTRVELEDIKIEEDSIRLTRGDSMNSLAVNWIKFRISGMFMDSSRFLVDFFGFYRELFGVHTQLYLKTR